MNLEFKKVLLLTRAQVKARYRDTSFGLAWSLMQPFIIVFSQVLLFSHLFGNQDSGFKAYILVGSLIWFYISQSVEKTSLVLKQSSAQYTNLHIKPLESVLSCHLENYFQFLVYSAVLFMVVMGPTVSTLLHILNFSLVSVFLFGFVFSFSYAISLYQVIYKDIKYLCQFFFATLYFLSPTFYKPEQLGLEKAHFLNFLPTTWILDFARLSIGQNLNQNHTTIGLFGLLCTVTAIWSIKTHQKIIQKVLVKL